MSDQSADQPADQSADQSADQPAGVKVVVNTCEGYFRVSVPRLLDSLWRAGVPRNEVIVVVGESEDPRDEIIDDVKYVFRGTYNIDNNGLVWLAEEHEFEIDEWIVYLHDTTEVDDDFWVKVLDLARGLRCNCARLVPWNSMGMGLYRASWLASAGVRDFMTGIKNLDPGKKLAIKNDLAALEDTLFKFAGSECETLKNPYVVDPDPRQSKPYGTDTPRIVEHYPIPGIRKFKANWGQSRVLKCDL